MSERRDCAIVGSDIRSSVIGRAMANGGMVTADEVIRSFKPSGGHVAAGTVLPLTVGEWVGRERKRFPLCVALGYEVGGRLMTILYRERDYVAAALSTSVAGASFRGNRLCFWSRSTLDSDGAWLAATRRGSGQHDQRSGPHGKTFQVAAANRNGVTAALLARKGCFVRSISRRPVRLLRCLPRDARIIY